MDARQQAARRWMESRLIRVEERPGDERVLEQPSLASLYADYEAFTPQILRWRPWRLSQELMYEYKAKQYRRKAHAAAKFDTSHFACVRLKPAAG